ncbi:MAG: hypothetical protein R3B53_02565 [Candidatus Paceibacterota bacterium]
MNEILHANIFFFIASIATVCFSILVCIALYHFIKAMKSVRAILTKLEEGSEVLAEDLAHVREMVANGAGIFTRIIGLFFGGTNPFAEQKRSKKVINRKNKLYGSKKEGGDFE